MDIPRLSLGAGHFRRETAADNIAAVHRALELGVTAFDTSPVYGHGASQPILGEALADAREPHFVATKIGYFTDRRHYRDEAAILEQVHSNLRMLRRDHVDLLQIHEADRLIWWTDNDEERIDQPIEPTRTIDFANAPVMDALRHARDQGLCRFIGITGNTTLPLTHVLKHVEVDAVLTAYNYDLINRSARRVVFPVALGTGVARIVAGPLAGGKLADLHREWLDDPPDWMPPRYRRAYAQVVEVHRTSGLDLPELGIRFVLSDPDITTLLTGAVTPREIERNVSIAEAGPLPPDVQRRLEQIGVEDPTTRLWSQ